MTDVVFLSSDCITLARLQATVKLRSRAITRPLLQGVKVRSGRHAEPQAKRRPAVWLGHWEVKQMAQSPKAKSAKSSVLAAPIDDAKPARKSVSPAPKALKPAAAPKAVAAATPAVQASQAKPVASSPRSLPCSPLLKSRPRRPPLRHGNAQKSQRLPPSPRNHRPLRQRRPPPNPIRRSPPPKLHRKRPSLQPWNRSPLSRRPLRLRLLRLR